jgi:DNA-binding HxlR family transcriptional regulator
MSPSPGRREGPTASLARSRVPEVPWEEVDRCFREFRESAVRLVEQVNDLVTTAQPARGPASKDVRLVRSVFGKWSMEVLVALHSSPSAGFEELRRALPGIGPRVLSLKLKALEEHGMVRREIVDSRPPRVRYALTEQGWTVAWLADPLLLFLSQLPTRKRAEEPAPRPVPELIPTER